MMAEPDQGSGADEGVRPTHRARYFRSNALRLSAKRRFYCFANDVIRDGLSLLDSRRH